MKFLRYIFLFFVVVCAHSQAMAQVVTEDIGKINLDLVGNERSEFDGLWQNQTLDQAISNISNTVDLTISSRILQFMPEVFMAPSFVQEDKDSFLFLTRVKKLVELDSLSQASNLIERISSEFWDIDIAKEYINILLLQGRDKKACSLSQEFLSKHKTKYFEELFNFCLLLDGKESQALVGLDLLIESTQKPSSYQMIAENKFHGTKHKIIPEPKIDGFLYALYNYSKIDFVDSMDDNQSLWALKMKAKSNPDAAKKMINLGVLKPTDLPKTITDEILLSDFTLDEYKKLFAKSWAEGLYYFAPLAYVEELKKLAITEDNMDHAGVIIKSLLLLRENKLAFIWYMKADYLANRNTNAKRIAMLYAPIFRLVNGYGQSNEVVINLYQLYKDSHGYDSEQTLQEVKMLVYFLEQKTDITDDALISAIENNQKGEVLYLGLQKIKDDPILVGQVSSAFEKVGFRNLVDSFIIDSILRAIDFGT